MSTLPLNSGFPFATPALNPSQVRLADNDALVSVRYAEFVPPVPPAPKGWDKVEGLTPHDLAIADAPAPSDDPLSDADCAAISANELFEQVSCTMQMLLRVRFDKLTPSRLLQHMRHMQRVSAAVDTLANTIAPTHP